ncbi:hypothetical protein D3C80_971300 [compost metagenome]
MEIVEIRYSARQGRRGVAKKTMAAESRFGLLGQQKFIVPGQAGAKHPTLQVAQGLDRHTAVIHQMLHGFHQQPLLRVHATRFVGRDAEKTRIELINMLQQAAMHRRPTQRLPSCDRGNATLTGQQVLPIGRQRLAAGQTAGSADNHYFLGRLQFQVCCHVVCLVRVHVLLL